MECEITASNEEESNSQSTSHWPQNIQPCPIFKDIGKGNNTIETVEISSGSNMGGTILMNENIGLTTPDDKQLNRRYSLRPRKRISKDIGSNFKKVMKRALKSSRHLKHPQLETIFEEPVVTKKGELLFIGLSKAKRSITFSQFVSKAKLKKRKSKVKKLKERLLAEKKKMEDVESKLWNLGL